MSIKQAASGILILVWTGNAIAQNTTETERQIIQQAIADASNRLNDTRCANFYGPDALNVLHAARFQMAPVGPPLPRPGSSGKFQRTALVIAVTYREFQLVVINRLGPFSEPGKPIGGRLYNWHKGDRDFRSLVVLHELGHLTARFNAEGTQDSTNDEHTAMVLRNCYGILANKINR